MNIREKLEEEMTKCYSLKLFKNRVKKCNEILPDCVLDNVFSFVRCDCKRCVRTRRVMDNESKRIQILRKDWEDVDVEEIYFTDQYIDYQKDALAVWLYYFKELNKMPWKKTFFGRFPDFPEYDYYNCYIWYDSLPDENIHIYRPPRNIYTRKLCDLLMWMVCERGCQFYPQIFDEEFQREVMFQVFGV